jgi:hypothetical protein
MFGRTRVALAAAVAALSLAVAAAPASAGTIDQQQLGTYTHFSVVVFNGVGQTFTAGRSGSLDQVDLFLMRTANRTTPLTVEIRNAAGDFPGSTVLASTSVPADQVPVGTNGNPSTLISVPIASPVPVVAETQYAIVAYTTPTPLSSYGLALTCGVSSYVRGRWAQSQALSGTDVPSSWNTFSQDCDFRFRTYVAPWNFSGFFSPVNNPTDPEPVNGVKAGQSVPVKFSLGGDQGLDVLAEDYPKLEFTQCDPGDEVDPVEETSTANNGLTYDALTDTYTYVWKTSKNWQGKCGTLTVKLDDGSEHTADFQFK